jgi:hypothetical protein
MNDLGSEMFAYPLPATFEPDERATKAPLAVPSSGRRASPGVRLNRPLERTGSTTTSVIVLTTAELAECTCPEFCERDHDLD